MSAETYSAAYEVPDTSWVCNAFIMGSGPQWDFDHERRYYSGAERKVGGAGLGEGRVMNMPPAPSEFADPPMGFGIDGKQDYSGMGVHYSSMDDCLDVIHIKPGKPRFSSLTRFYLNAMQADAIKSNDYGWFDKTVNAITGAVGYLLLIPFKLVGSVWDVLHKSMSNDDTNRYSYYYLAPATFAFWRSVDNIVNDFALRSGVIPGAAFDGNYDDGTPPNKQLSDDDLAYFTKNIPGVYKGGKFGVPRIDVLAISCRHMLMNSRREEYLAKMLDKTYQKELTDDYAAKWEQVMLTHNPWGGDDTVRGVEGVQALGEAMVGANTAMREQYNRIIHSDIGAVLGSMENQVETVKADDGTFTSVYKAIDSLLGADEASKETVGRVAPEMDDEGFVGYMREVVRGGAEWVSFAVDEITETKISVTNNSGPSGLAEMINGVVTASRTAQFNIAGGNIGDGMTASAIEGTLKTAAAGLSGLTNQFVGGMPAAIMGGKAFIDIPDVYTDSTMEFDSLNYSLTSTSSSGHPLAKLRMLMPYFCLLALASPQSAGPASYSPPFLVELQHKGKSIVQLGMIGSLSALFGEGGDYDINDIPNTVKMDFDVVNLSKGFHIPVDPDAAMTYRDTGAFSLHMSVLAGTALTDRDRSMAYNLKRSIMTVGQRADRFLSASNWALMMGSGLRSFGPSAALLNMGGVYSNRR